MLALLTSGLMVSASASAATPSYKAGVDPDGNGRLDQTEFVMAMGERAMRQRDTNKDGQLSSAEWLGKNKGEFQALTLERFNTNGDNIMAADEIVEVFLWVFSKRDKNGDGMLSADETPPALLNK